MASRRDSGAFAARARGKNDRVLHLGAYPTEEAARHVEEDWWANPAHATYESWIIRLRMRHTRALRSGTRHSTYASRVRAVPDPRHVRAERAARRQQAS